MRTARKQLELLLINYFRKNYSDFPKGNIVASESPDFILKQKNRKKLGIELTRLYTATVGEDKMQTSPLENPSEIIETSRELFERNTKWKLFVKFLFTEPNRIDPVRVLPVSAMISNRIRKTVIGKNPRSFFHHNLRENELPAGVKEILIIHHPGLGESVWEEANNLGVSENIIDDIDRIIQKKEDKLSLYRKQQLDENWLLISSDYLQAAKNYNIHNQLLRKDFHSGFDRILLFDLLRQRTFEWIK